MAGVGLAGIWNGTSPLPCPEVGPDAAIDFRLGGRRPGALRRRRDLNGERAARRGEGRRGGRERNLALDRGRPRGHARRGPAAGGDQCEHHRDAAHHVRNRSAVIGRQAGHPSHRIHPVTGKLWRQVQDVLTAEVCNTSDGRCSGQVGKRRASCRTPCRNGCGRNDRRQTPLHCHKAPVAQWIEHRPSKPRVAGSSPAGRASFFEGLRCHRRLVCNKIPADRGITVVRGGYEIRPRAVK